MPAKAEERAKETGGWRGGPPPPESGKHTEERHHADEAGDLQDVQRSGQVGEARRQGEDHIERQRTEREEEHEEDPDEARIAWHRDELEEGHHDEDPRNTAQKPGTWAATRAAAAPQGGRQSPTAPGYSCDQHCHQAIGTGPGAGHRGRTTWRGAAADDRNLMRF